MASAEALASAAAAVVPFEQLVTPPQMVASEKKVARRPLPEPDLLAQHFAPVVRRIKDSSTADSSSWQYLVTMTHVDSWMPTIEDLENNFDLLWLILHFVPWRIPPTNYVSSILLHVNDQLGGSFFAVN